MFATESIAICKKKYKNELDGENVPASGVEKPPRQAVPRNFRRSATSRITLHKIHSSTNVADGEIIRTLTDDQKLVAGFTEGAR